MACEGKFNIFGPKSQQPDKSKSFNMFSMINDFDENGNPAPRPTVSKRQHFRNEIRQQKNQQKKKFMRKQLIKSLQSNNLFTLIENLAAKDNIEFKNISHLIGNIQKNLQSIDFCKKLNEHKRIKNFILDLYLKHQSKINLEQKGLLLSCLTYMTYFSTSVLFNLEQKQLLNDTMIKEISEIHIIDEPHIEYLRKNIDLLTNIISDEDADINHYLMDSHMFSAISQKITEITNEAQRIVHQQKNPELVEKFDDGLNNIRDAFISALHNLSSPEYHNEPFFEFTLNQLVGDVNYLKMNGPEVLKIFSKFFKNEKFRQSFLESDTLTNWFQNSVCLACQQKFSNSEYNKTGNFPEIRLTANERELFFEFIHCLLTFIQEEEEDQNANLFDLIVQLNTNLFYLSEFLIQCSEMNPTDQTVHRKSRYVSEAIKLYEHLASNSNLSLKKLLTVTSERKFEDIFKVLLDDTYFTSCKISDVTISLLNKMLSKDSQLLKTLFELCIFEKIDLFLSMADECQKPQQILNFFELLTLMIASDQELVPKLQRKFNYVAKTLQQNGSIQKIQRYQDAENKAVAEKAEAFLEYFCSNLQQNRQSLLEI